MADVGLPVDEKYAPPARVKEGAHVASREAYDRMYQHSVNDPDGFWKQMADEHIMWIAPFGKVRDEDLRTGKIAWFLDGKLNVAANCLDRHLATRGDKTAILWEGDEPGQNRTVTYRELAAMTNKLANALRKRGVTKGDRVAIYMGMEIGRAHV